MGLPKRVYRGFLHLLFGAGWSVSHICLKTTKKTDFIRKPHAIHLSLGCYKVEGHLEYPTPLALSEKQSEASERPLGASKRPLGAFMKVHLEHLGDPLGTSDWPLGLSERPCRAYESAPLASERPFRCSQWSFRHFKWPKKYLK